MSELKRYTLIFLGLLCTGMGIAGILLPLIPGTPFLLLAAFFFSRSSESFHQWLLHHRYLGRPIRQWEEKGAISWSSKLLATSLIVLSSLFVLPRDLIPWAGKVAYSLTLAAVLLFIWTRPSQ